MQQESERRKSPRRKLRHLQGKLHHAGTTTRVTVLDVSREGMQISVPAPLSNGEGVTFSMLGVDIPAIVHWSHDDKAGLRLIQELDRNTLIALDSAQAKIERLRQEDPAS